MPLFIGHFAATFQLRPRGPSSSPTRLCPEGEAFRPLRPKVLMPPAASPDIFLDHPPGTASTHTVTCRSHQPEGGHGELHRL